VRRKCGDPGHLNTAAADLMWMGSDETQRVGGPHGDPHQP
jgi:hypothetical protein